MQLTVRAKRTNSLEGYQALLKAFCKTRAWGVMKGCSSIQISLFHVQKRLPHTKKDRVPMALRNRYRRICICSRCVWERELGVFLSIARYLLLFGNS